MARVFVFGASGYSGLELLRLLARHPRAEVVAASSDRWADQPISDHVAGYGSPLRFSSHERTLELADEGVAFLATPNETSASLAPTLLDRGLRVIDLSGAFRLEAAQYPDWYGFSHPCPELLSEAWYGLPELCPLPQPTPRLVANPGCYATAAQLAVAPLVAGGLIESDSAIMMDGKSGATGAGRKLADELLFSEVADTIRPYRVGQHQHTPEIERYLGRLAPSRASVSLTAHLIPIRRGLIVSAYLKAKPGVEQGDLDRAYTDYYAAAAFVRWTGLRPPEPGLVAWTNFCDVTARLDPRTGSIVAFGAIDNLVKGAAGQAIQNLNFLLGLTPTMGLLGSGEK